MGGALFSCCADKHVHKNVLLAGRSGSGKTHTLYQMLGDVASLDTRPTPGTYLVTGIHTNPWPHTFCLQPLIPFCDATFLSFPPSAQL
jgi:hypothetical protein